MKISFFLALQAFLIATIASGATPKNPQSPTPTLESDGAADSTKANSPAKSAKLSPTQHRATSLGTITTDVEGDLTVVTVRLNQKPNWSEISIEEHGTFLQIKFPKTQVPASGEFIDGNGPFLKKLATFQLPDDDGALRLFLNLDAGKAKMATTAELLGERVVVTIDHKKLEQLIAPQTGKAEAQTAEDVVAKTVVDKSLPAPSDQIAAQTTTNDSQQISESTLGQDLYGKLARVAAFGAILFGALIAAQTYRSRRQGRPSRYHEKADNEPAALKILSSLNLGQKQRLTLVQVGHQQILLGVSSDSINLLTTVEPKSRTQNFAMSLESANPSATVRLKAAEEISHSKPQRRPISAATTGVRTEAPVKGGRINVAVGDDGISETASRSSKTDDITKLLRDRLRNIPPR
jgi:flagellar biogenesis protein FliO